MKFMDKKMKEVCIQRGLHLEDDMAYGWLGGCFITLATQSASGILAYLSVKVYVGKVEQAEEQAERAGTVRDTVLNYAHENPKTCKLIPARAGLPLVEMTDDNRMVCIRFQFAKAERFFTMLEDLLSQLAPMCLPKTCACCGLPEDTAALQPMRLDETTVMPFHEACVEEEMQTLSTQEDAVTERQGGSVAAGFVGALVGGLLGAAVWALVGIMGYIASIVGLLIAFLSAKGYDLMHGRAGKAKIIVLIVCIVLAVIVGNCTMYVYQVYDSYDESMDATYEYLLEKEVSDYSPTQRDAMLSLLRALNPKEKTIETLKEEYPIAEYMRDTIAELPSDADFVRGAVLDLLMGLFFAFWGCLGMLRSTFGQQKKTVKPHTLQGSL